MKMLDRQTDRQTDSNRLIFVDVCKTIGIILVVVGHHLLGVDSLVGYINSFHMPLFFIITGYLFAYKDEWKKSISQIIMSKLKSLIYPYLTLSIIVILWHFVFYCIIFKNRIPEKSTAEVIYLTVTTYGYHALWFLPCLFLASVLYLLVRKYKIQHFLCLSLTIVLSIPLVNDFFNFSKVTIYFYRLLVAVTFIYYGNLLYIALKQAIVKKILLACSLILSALSVVCYFFFSQFFPTVNVSSGIIGNPYLFYLFALANAYSIIVICKQVFRNQAKGVFTFLGKNSLIIMALHMDITVEIGWLIVGRIPIALNQTLSSLIVILIEFILCYVIIRIINNRFPFIVHFPGKWFAKKNRQE